MSGPKRVAIVGAGGRMGRSLLENAPGQGELEVVAALEHPGSALLGQRLGPQGITVTGSLAEHIGSCDVVVDFSTPASCLQTARMAASAGVALVSGTTGLGGEELEELYGHASEIALIHAANFSVGVNVLAELAFLASQATGEAFDMEVFEAHHKHKVDAPSGTALWLGEQAARGRGHELEDVAVWAREGQVGVRHPQEIGFSVVRGGDIVGEHTLFYCAQGERLELTHRATDRGIFARGALRAAGWLAKQRAGRYSMRDVLFGPGAGD